MSTGTAIILPALQRIGVHSPLSPANPESIQTTKNVLNGMIAMYQDEGIEMGCVPLKEPGSELSEPLGAREAIINNLAIAVSTEFPGAKVSRELISEARKGYNMIQRQWEVITIPKRKTRGTLPRGQGNQHYRHFYSPFFNEGDEIGEDTTS